MLWHRACGPNRWQLDRSSCFNKETGKRVSCVISQCKKNCKTLHRAHQLACYPHLTSQELWVSSPGCAHVAGLRGLPWKQDFFFKLPVGPINLASLNLMTEGIVAVNMDKSWEIIQNEESAFPPLHIPVTLRLYWFKKKNLYLRNPEKVQKKLEVLCQPARLLFGSNLAFTFPLWREETIEACWR